MQLGEIVKALRDAHGWGTPQLAARVSKHHDSKVSYQNIQQLEDTPGRRPRYVRALAAAFEKTVEDLYAWRPGMPIKGPNKPAKAPADDGEEMSPGLRASRFKHDIDQLRVTVLTMLDVLSASLPGTAAVLRNRLELAVAPDYAERGFHARLLDTLETMCDREVAARADLPRRASHAPSARKR